MSKVILYEEYGEPKREVDLPLTSLVRVENMAKELHLPSYIDLDYFPMRNAIVTVWACQKAPDLHRLYPSAYEKEVDKKSIDALLFGGGAMKFHCEHSNGKGPLSRSIKDTDFIVPKSQGSRFEKMLFGMASSFGTQYTYFRTRSDRLFNAVRGGQRYRVRAINGINTEGLPSVTSLDIFCDSIDLCHKIEIKESFNHCRGNLYTIGLENLVLTKSQFINETSDNQVAALKEQNQGFRILPYPWYASGKIVLGMEEKDVKDVCAIFLDHPLGEGSEKISEGKMRKALDRDKKLALTVTLNLKNIAAQTSLLEGWLGTSDADKVVERINAALEDLPQIDKKWSKPWWNSDVETPMID